MAEDSPRPKPSSPIVTEHETAVVGTFNATFGGLSTAVLLVSEAGRVVGSNAAAGALFVLEAGDLTNQLWPGLDANTNLFGWRSIWRTLTESGHYAYDTAIFTGREYLRPVGAEVVLLEPGFALVHLSNQLTEELLRAELRTIEQRTHLGIWSYNRIDRELFLSDIARELFGLPAYPEPVSVDGIKEHLLSALAPTDAEQLVGLAASVMNEPRTVTEDLTIELPEGTRRITVQATSVSNTLHVTHAYGFVVGAANPARQLTETTDVVLTDNLATFSLEQAPDMIFWTRPDGTVFYANKAVGRKLGYTAAQLDGMSVQRFAPNFTEEAREGFWERLRSERIFDLEYDLTTSGGSLIRIMAAVNYIRFGDQEYACSVCRDITTRKLEDKRKQLMEFTFDENQDMIVWSRPDGTLYNVNRPFLERSGYSREDLERITVPDIVPERKLDLNSLWERLRTEKHLSLDTHFLTKDGATWPVRATLNYLIYQGEEYNCVYLEDMRERKQRDKILHLSEVAMDTAQDCILWLDGNYRIQYLNQTLRSITGQSLEHWIDEPVDRLFRGLRIDDLVPGSNHLVVLRDGEHQRHELDLSCSSIRHDGEHFLILIGRDVTALTERSRSLEEAYREIAELRDMLQSENITLREDVDTKYNIDNIITVSPKYRKVLQQVGRVANVDTTVLITGETGTGKELLARAVHYLSERNEAPLVKVNCAALPESLIESELFGHEKGAFTGAVAQKKGRFEMANKGTIFLDEIGELPLDLQAKLLRVLQEGEFERLGGTQTLEVDIRLIAATNRNLEEMVRQGKFREDLYYRLNVFPIHNLPLRERPEDIRPLVDFFAAKFAKQQGKKIEKINTADLKKLRSYSFPGNIRELENLVERSVVLCSGNVLSIKLQRGNTTAATTEVFPSLEESQRRHIVEALKRTGGRVTGPQGAGQLLQLNDRTLVSRMRKLGIEKHEYLI